MKTHTIFATLMMALILAAGTPAMAADHQVKMLNKGKDGVMVFEPSALRIAAGDTVTFVSVDPGHNAETIPGMIPAGAEAFRTPMGKDTTISFSVAGLYGVKCTPHLPMGMVVLIQVGDDSSNLDALKAKKMPPAATKRLSAAYTTLGL